MSLDRCFICSATVDTDDDTDAYFLTLADGRDVRLDVCRCEDCRNPAFPMIAEHAPDDRRSIDP
jgi:hypothetical protein